MSDYPNTISQSEPDLPLYIPNPAAARLIAAFIQTAYFPSSIPECMTGYWPLALAEIQTVADKSERERFQAFSAFTVDLPKEQSWGMMFEVRSFLLPKVNRTEKDRQLFWAKDAMSPPPVVEWAVPGLFARPSLNILVGDPGSKKTFLAIDLAVCVALGQPWLGRPTIGAPVIFVDEESGAPRFHALLNGSLRAHGGTDACPIHYFCLPQYDLRGSADCVEVLGNAQSAGAGLIIIDALSNVLRGGNENTTTSVIPILNNLRLLSEMANCAILLVHHNKKTGGFRGSSAIAAGADLLLSIQSPPGESLIQLQALKSRIVSPQPFAAQIHFEGDLFYVTDSDQVHERKYGSAASAVLDYLQRHGQATTPELVTVIDYLSKSAVRQAVYQLMRSGHINRIDPGARREVATLELSGGSSHANP